jgi:hypothetical protein
MSGAAVRCCYSECITVMKSDLPVVKVAIGSNAERRLTPTSSLRPPNPSAQAAHPVCNPVCGLGQRYLGSCPRFSTSGRRRSASRALVWARQAGCHKYFGFIITVLII